MMVDLCGVRMPPPAHRSTFFDNQEERPSGTFLQVAGDRKTGLRIDLRNC
jgi:hypothetical protein